MKRKLLLSVIAGFFYLITAIGCKKDGLEAGGGAATGKANLTIETVDGPNKEECGGFLWKVKFNLNDASAKGGWVVQKITYDQVVINCPDVPYINKKITYWEAWRVSAGAKGDSERLSGKFNFDDQYSSPNYPDTRGSTNITGEVKFFEGLDLPAGFTKNNNATYAGGLPSTTDKPAFWDNTNSAGHDLGYVWNCCSNTHVGVLTTTPTETKTAQHVIADTSVLDQTGKLIFRIPSWTYGYYSTASQQLINIARQVQSTTTATSLHNSLLRYENLFAGTSEYVEQMSKAYLLLRVMYQLPQEMNSTNAKVFGGWVHPCIGSGPAFNMSWPVTATQSTSGLQVSVANYNGFIGRGYNAAAEMDYFNSSFPKRNL
jgi:hypothetical protein